ncbi:MAG: ProQ/FinO family protein [Gammaproteobacteria bacterium]|nr:ProQ/FinO family protein [Gammaproteobacteria bacterium]
MSNLSLKEQLQAIALDIPSSTESNKTLKKDHPKKHAEKEVTKTRQPQAPNAPQNARPAWLEQAKYGVELLKVHFPGCFKENADIVPLKIGIRHDLIKHLGSRTDIALADKACMSSSLSYYVNSIVYHRKVREGAIRFDLEGNPAGAVTAEEANYSETRCAAKQKKKQKDMSVEK